LWDEVGDITWSLVDGKHLKTVCDCEWHVARKKKGIYGEKSGREWAA